jgi:hypothetical protein
MVIQAHRVSVGEEMIEHFTLSLRRNATVLHVHHYNLAHGHVELVVMHDEHEEPAERRFVIIDSFCCEQVPLPPLSLRYISTLAYDNHVFNFFEVLD